jgi:DNA-binding CsgD family transcriptional regulator
MSATVHAIDHDAGAWAGRRMHGRGRELAAAAAWLDRLALHPGSALVVTGVAGIGKSSLLRAIATRADDAGCSVVRARAVPGEQSRPLGALLDAVSMAPTVVPSHDQTVRMSAATGHEFAVLERVLDEIERSAAGRPVCLVVDDLHWADAATLRSIRLIASRLHRTGGGIAVGARPVPAGHPLRSTLAELAERTSTTTIDLQPLSPRATLAVARDHQPDSVDLRAIVREAHGNPLLVESLIRTHHSGHGSGTDAIADACSVVGPECHELLTVAALLGNRIEPELLARLADVSPIVVRRALDEAAVAGVVSLDPEPAFRHDLYREHLSATLTPGVRRALHVAAARLLTRLGRPTTEIAEHYRSGADVGDLDAIEALHRAALDVARTSPGSALPLFDAALALHGGIAPDTELLADQMQALAWSGDVVRAEALGELLLTQVLTPKVRYRVHHELAFVAFVRGDVAMTIQHLDHALPVAPTDALLARTMAERSLAVFASADLHRAECDATESLAAAQRSGDVPAMSLATSVLAFTSLMRGDVATSRRHASRLEVWSTGAFASEAVVYQPMFFALLVAFEGHDSEAFSRITRAGRRLAEQSSTVWAVPLFDALDAFDALRGGRLDEVVASATAGVELSSDANAFAAAGWCLGLWAQAEVLRGDLDLAARLSERAEAEYGGPQSKFGPEQVAIARAALLERAGDRRAAFDHLHGTWLVLDAAGFHMPLAWIAPALARLAVLAGDAATASVVADRTDALAATSGLADVRAAAVHARAWAEGDVIEMGRAVRAFDAADMPLAAALASRDAHQLASATDDPSATSLHVDAERRLSAIGAAGEVERLCANSVEPAGTRRADVRPVVGWDALTHAQRRVAALVSEGRSNPEIAEALYVSRRTVESHIAAILRTMGVRTRAELIVELYRSAPRAR